MRDEDLRDLEREAILSTDARATLAKELRRLGRAFEDCDACWGNGFTIVAAKVVERCSFCERGEPRKRAEKNIADEVPVRFSGSHWRATAIRACAAALERLPKHATEREARSALCDAYPFGPRAHHPYKVWLDEVKKQLRARFGRDLATPLLDRPENAR